MKGLSAGGLQASEEVRRPRCRPTLTTDSTVLLHQMESPGKKEEYLEGKDLGSVVQLTLRTRCPGTLRRTLPAQLGLGTV